MKNKFAAPVASAATAILLLGACGDDDNSSSTTTEAGPTIVAKGEDIELVGGPESGLGNQNLDIDVVEEDGEVTGEFRITDQSGTQPPNVFPIQCADTDTDGIVILGGVATAGSDFKDLLHAVIIREGEPDSVSLAGPDGNGQSCTELLASISDEDIADDSNFEEVEAGSDIETG